MNEMIIPTTMRGFKEFTLKMVEMSQNNNIQVGDFIKMNLNGKVMEFKILPSEISIEEMYNLMEKGKNE
jgi:hypothetical protein